MKRAAHNIAPTLPTESATREKDQFFEGGITAMTYGLLIWICNNITYVLHYNSA